MKRWTRALAVAVPVLAAVGALAGPAAAADEPVNDGACAAQAAGYGARGACQLLVEVLEPECISDVPYLHYTVLPQGTPKTKVTLTWINPDGDDVVMTDLPLSGTVLWPGTEVADDGTVLDWPGWTQAADGTWTEGDEYSWTRPDVQLHFQVNPEVTVTASYPAATAACAGPVQSSVLSAPEDPAVTTTQEVSSEVLAAGSGSVGTTFRSQVLAATGAEPEPVLLVAGGLLVVGGVALGTRAALRRRTARA